MFILSIFLVKIVFWCRFKGRIGFSKKVKKLKSACQWGKKVPRKNGKTQTLFFFDFWIICCWSFNIYFYWYKEVKRKMPCCLGIQFNSTFLLSLTETESAFSSLLFRNSFSLPQTIKQSNFRQQQNKHHAHSQQSFLPVPIVCQGDL